MQDSLGFKLGFSFALVGLILLGALLITLFEIHHIGQIADKMSTEDTSVISPVVEISRGLEQIKNIEKNMVEQKNPRRIVEINHIWKQQIIPAVSAIRSSFNFSNNTIGNENITSIAKQLQKIKLNQLQFKTALQQKDYTRAKELVDDSPETIDDMINLIEELVTSQHQGKLNSISDIKKRTARITIMDSSFLLVGIILCAIMVTLLTRSITRPIYRLVAITKSIATGCLDQAINISGTSEFEELSDALKEMVITFQDLAEVTENMAKGDYTHRVNVKSSQDRLAITVNQMLDNFNQIIRQTNAIADGHYNTEIKPRSEKDILGNALQNMTIKLRHNKQFSDNENWMKDGLTNFASNISGCHDLHKLFEIGISTICRYIDAGVGSLYLYNKTANELTLSGSYALNDSNKTRKVYKIGEGIIGQVAKEHKTILVKNIPKNSLNISCGVVNIKLQQVIAVPITYENNLLAVIEIGAIHKILELQKRYIEQTIKIFAAQLHSANQQTITKKLLHESKMLTKKMKIQQEELRVKNNKLEKQTKILQASEDKLKQKDEFQRKINKELERRNIVLERQKYEIEQKKVAIQRVGEELRQKAGELERASRYKSEFLTNMSHELRTPLNSLLILAKMFVENDGGNLTRDQIDSANIMLKSGQDLLTLINDILDLAKVEAGKIELYNSLSDITTYIEHVKRIFTHVAEKKGIKFTTKKDQNIPASVYTDEKRVMQIIRNLIANAIKFTEYGQVTLYIHRPCQSIVFSNKNLFFDKVIAFSVIDSGIGIADDKKKLIFDSFRQADGNINRKYGGTGLGLSISSQFANLLGGEIQVESSEGIGSTFTFYLPEKPTPQDIYSQHVINEKPIAYDENSNIKKSNQYFLSKKNNLLLIVEDDNTFAKIITRFANKQGFKCMHAENAMIGFEYAKKYQPLGILLDISLPGMDGLSLLDKLRSDPITHSIPVHVISSKDDKSDAIRKGAIGYLTKPVDKLQVENAIKKIESITNSNLKNILVIGNDQNILSSIQEKIADRNIKLSWASNGQDALVKMAKKDYDCLILDLELPDVTSQMLLDSNYRNDNHQNAPIIIYTGQQTSETENNQSINFIEFSPNLNNKTAIMKNLNKETGDFLNHVKKCTNIRPKEKPATQCRLTKNKKILLVDNDMRNVFALSKILRNKGFEVFMAANGKKAIESIETIPDIDLVLMDIMMPIMDGYQAIKTIRQRTEFKSLPIIALTAKTMKVDQEKCCEVGASDFISKPVDIDKLITIIEKWLFKDL